MKFCLNFEFGAVQRCANLVDLEKCLNMNIWLQKSASIRKRTSPLKFDHLAEKSEYASISNLSTKVKNSKEAHEAQKQTSKDAIKVDLLRLEKAYIEKGFVHGDLREFGIKTETKRGVRRITNVDH